MNKYFYIVLLLSALSRLAAWTVSNADSGEVFADIAAAVSDTDTLNGHTIYAGPGTYNTFITLNKELAIISYPYITNNDMEAVVLTGNGRLSCQADNCLVQGLNFNQTAGQSVESPVANNISNLKILDCIVASNTSGSGIFIDTGFDVLISNCIIKANNVHGGQLMNITGLKLYNSSINSNTQFGFYTDGCANVNIIHNDVRNNCMAGAAGNYTAVQLLNSVSNINVISNTIISEHHYAHEVLRIHGPEKSLVAYNEISGSPWIGINIAACNNITVLSNDIHDNGTNGIWLESATTACSFIGNQVYNHTNGYIIPSTSSDIEIFSNRMYSNGIAINTPGVADLKIYRNLLRNNSSNVIFGSGAMNNLEIINNTIVANNNGLDLPVTTPAIIANNIFLDNSGIAVNYDSTGAAALDYNLFHNNSTDTNGNFSSVTSNTNGDPQLMETPGDYRITAGSSPAVDNGTDPAGSFTFSYFGNNTDIGWKEFLAAVPQPAEIRVTNTAQHTVNNGTISISGYATNADPGLDPAGVYRKINSGSYNLITSNTSWSTAVNTDLLGEGTNYYTFLAVTTNNLSNTYILTNIVDRTAPVVSLDPGGSFTTNQAFTLNVSVNEDNGYWSTNNGAAWNTMTAAGADNLNITTDTSIIYYGRDTAGNSSATNTNTYSFDTAAPVVTITSGPDSNIITNQAFAIQLTASENWGYWSTNGIPYQQFNDTLPLNIPVNTTTTLTFYGEDAFANNSGTNTVTYTFDTTPPVITVNNPTNNAYITGTYHVDGTLNDTPAGVAQGTLHVSNNSGYTTNFTLSSGSWNQNWPTGSISDGSYVFFTSAADNLGNTITNNVRSLTVDNSPPLAAITNLSNNQIIGSDNYLFAGTLDDPDSGIAAGRLVITNHGGIVIDQSISAGSWSYDYNALANGDGEFVAFIAARNRAGLTATNAVTPFAVWNGLVYIAETNTGLYIKSNHTFSGRATNTMPVFDPAAVYYSTNNGSGFIFITNKTYWNITINTADFNDGPARFIFRAVSPNNRTNYYTNNVIIDNSPPVMADYLNFSNLDIYQTTNIFLADNDPHSGISNQFLLLIADTGITNTNSSLTVIDPADYSSGEYTLLIAAVNGAGLTNTAVLSVRIVNLELDIKLGPNPVAFNKEVLIKGLTRDSVVKIYNVTGFAVKSYNDILKVSDRQDRKPGNISWNLQNSEQQQVAPGLYIIIISDPALEEKSLYKITVIR